MGVSNTAGTLNFINNMSKFDKEEIKGMMFASLATLFVIGLGVLEHNIFNTNAISSPVEEMYHRQLVVTLDSVLDAHLNAATLKELKDKDSASIADHTHYEKYFVPME